jgi:hypothetical protein
MIPTKVYSVLVDIDRDAEFSGDDVDRFSKLLDLGSYFENIAMWIPTIDSSTIGLYAQRDGSIASVPVPIYHRKVSDESTVAWATTAGTGGYMIVCDRIGGVQYLRIYCGSDQTADRTILVQGLR